MTPGRLAARQLKVEVPASTANLGAGFDVLAMALDLVNVVDVEAIDGSPGSLELEIEGEGENALGNRVENRFLAGLEAGLAAGSAATASGAGSSGAGSNGGWRIHMINRIPFARGLGSSAAATIAGLVAANAFLGDALDQADLLRLATRIEGHPDNAAAALLGGFVVVAGHGDATEVVRFDVPERLRAVLFVPDRAMSTSEMRAALPASVPFADAVHNVGAAALAVAAIAAGRLELLGPATEDRLHEPYRADVAYRELPQLTAAAREAGALGACLSGAGSSIIAFVDDEPSEGRVASAFEATAARLGLGGMSRVIRPRGAGARVLQQA